MMVKKHKRRRKKAVLAVCHAGSHRDVGDLEPKVRQCLFKRVKRDTRSSPNSPGTLGD